MVILLFENSLNKIYMKVTYFAEIFQDLQKVKKGSILDLKLMRNIQKI